MKLPSQNEVHEGTFKINSPKRHSHSTQVKLNHCVRQVLQGQNIEDVCQRVFGNVSDVRLDDIRTAIGKRHSKKDETEFVTQHRNDLKNKSGAAHHEPTLGKEENSNGPQKVHSDKSILDNRRMRYE